MTLLLCEDERDLSAAIRKILEISKYKVDVAYDGIQALEAISSRHYDGIILDVMMPRMDGFQVLKRIRAEGNNVPVIMLTARAEIDDKVLGLDSGADDYLTKPFEAKELLARIKAMLRRGGDIAPLTNFGNLVLDPNTSTMKAISGVRLTQTEFRIMEYLVRNKARLVSSDDLMNALWDYDSDAGINVVWTYISSLRKKLDAIGADCAIKAVRGIGYQLEAKQ